MVLDADGTTINAFDAIGKTFAHHHSFGINPARACACGDEKKDFIAASGSGMHPFMVSYGFESFERLEKKIGVPPELISKSPAELRERLLHALDIGDEAQGADAEPVQDGQKPA